MRFSDTDRNVMATRNPSEGLIEECATCGRETVHFVTVQIRTESGKQQNAEFSREPYRVSECRDCGSEDVIRMNNA